MMQYKSENKESLREKLNPLNGIPFWETHGVLAAVPEVSPDDLQLSGLLHDLIINDGKSYPFDSHESKISLYSIVTTFARNIELRKKYCIIGVLPGRTNTSETVEKVPEFCSIPFHFLHIQFVCNCSIMDK